MNYSHKILRKKTKSISVGGVLIGGDAPVSVQTMTNTITHDVDETLSQISLIEEAGADLVRISIPDSESSKALSKIIPNINVLIITPLRAVFPSNACFRGSKRKNIRIATTISKNNILKAYLFGFVIQ